MDVRIGFNMAAGCAVAIALMAPMTVFAIERTARTVTNPTADLQRLLIIPSCPNNTPVGVLNGKFECLGSLIPSCPNNTPVGVVNGQLACLSSVVPNCPNNTPVGVVNGQLACLPAPTNNEIYIGGVCFKPAKIIKCNWNWSGKGNDDSFYIRSAGQDGGSYCGSIGRDYVGEDMILARCR